MPPVDFSDLTMARKPRTRLNFGQMPACGQSTSLLKMRHQNIQQDENVAKEIMTPVAKRRRFDFSSRVQKSEPEIEMGDEDSLSSIIDAVEKLSTNSSLVADGTRANILPTVPGKHSDLSAISPETMADALDGVYDNRMEKVTIIDCRYPYEYNGGHIEGALNLYTKDAIQQFLQESITSSTIGHVLIFHCEFSSERGPKMYRFLRSLDRDLNKEHYPRLNFPEIYLLEGGYKAFFYTSKEKCSPQTYTPMLHKEHKEELRHFRVKSKSWSAGDRPHKASIKGTGMKLRF